MNTGRAFEIVIELARQNIHEDDPEQTEACNMVEDFFTYTIADLYTIVD